MSFLKLNDHLNIDVTWNMKGNVQVFVNEGLNYIYEDDFPHAINNFTEAITIDSSLWVCYYYRGIANKKLYQLREAEHDLLKATKLKTDQPGIYLELGEIYHAQHLYKKAQAAYEMSVKVNPNFVYGYFNLGNLSLMTGDIKKALRFYEDCNRVNPKFPDAYLNQGILKFKVRKNDNTSIELFDKALQVDSTFLQAYFWRGLAYLSMDQPEKCITDWNTLVGYDPENSFFTLMRGFLYIELKDYNKAFVDLRKALRAANVNEDKFEGSQTILDKSIDLHAAANYLIATGYGLNESAFEALKKAFCLLLASKNEEALNSLEMAEKIQPSATVYFLKAIAYEHSGQHPKAYEYYSRALSLDKDIFDAYKKRAVYRMELKDWNGANHDFNNMLRLQPESPVVYRLRGIMKSNQEDYEGAINDLSKFIATDSSDFESLRTRSVCYLLLDKQKEANDDQRRILRITPENWQLYEDVASNYLILHDTLSAVVVLKEFADAKPSIFIPFFTLSKIYVAQKKWADAKTEIEKLMPLMSPDYMPQKYSEALFWQGLIEFEASKDYSLAVDKFTKALEYDKTNSNAKYYRAKAYEMSGQIKKSLVDLKDLKDKGFQDSKDLYESLRKRQDN